MTGLGTLINCGAVLAGAAVGIFIKSGLKERFQKTVVSAVGLAVIFIGISGTVSGMLKLENGGFSVSYTMPMVLCLVIGAFFGELVNIEDKLERVGAKIEKRFKSSESKGSFVEGFVSTSILFCVGAMAIIGSLQDGLGEGISILASKSVLDGVMSVIYAASLGYGVFFSVIPLAVYQGAITAFAGFIKPYLTDSLIEQVSVVGYVLIFAIGLNLVLGKKIKVGNLLPAVLLPFLYYALEQLFRLIFNT